MTSQTLTLEVPAVLYCQLKQRADHAQRSVEAETLELLAATVPATEELPANLQQALTPLALLDDEALRHAAHSRLGTEAAAELEALHFKQQREGLTEAETQRRIELINQDKRAMLVRAQALALLRERGHDISNLVPEERREPVHSGRSV
jgi:plasmid stability protein